jgi:hypothetical protein
MNRNPATNWDEFPLVMGVNDYARARNKSVSWVYRKLEAGVHLPGLMPRDGNEEWAFSKKKLRDYLEGGYANFSRIRKAS